MRSRAATALVDQAVSAAIQVDPTFGHVLPRLLAHPRLPPDVPLLVADALDEAACMTELAAPRRRQAARQAAAALRDLAPFLAAEAAAP